MMCSLTALISGRWGRAEHLWLHLSSAAFHFSHMTELERIDTSLHQWPVCSAGARRGPPLPPLSRRTPTLFMELSVTEPCRWIREDWNHADTKTRDKEEETHRIKQSDQWEYRKIQAASFSVLIETWSTSVSLQPDSNRFRSNTNFFWHTFINVHQSLRVFKGTVHPQIKLQWRHGSHLCLGQWSEVNKCWSAPLTCRKDQSEETEWSIRFNHHLFTLSLSLKDDYTVFTTRWFITFYLSPFNPPLILRPVQGPAPQVDHLLLPSALTEGQHGRQATPQRWKTA